MKNFYYFSKNKLKFVEIHNFQKKFIFVTIFFSLVISFFIFGSYYVISEYVNPNSKVDALVNENQQLTSKYHSVIKKLMQLEKRFADLETTNNDLRLSVNLPPLTKEERGVGIGGGLNLNPSSPSELAAVVDRIDTVLARLEAKINFETNNYVEIKNQLASREEYFDALPSIRPCAGTIGDGFGSRYNPFFKSAKILERHEGIDIRVDQGTEVIATGNGIVTKAGWGSGYGQMIDIEHGSSGFLTRYGHLSKIFVKSGSRVKRGDVIGLSGNTGRSTGPHLHYEIMSNGTLLDPMTIMIDDNKYINIFKNDGKKF